MLGTIHDKWSKSESVNVRKGDKFVIVRGKRLELKIIEENKLQLSQLETIDNKNEKYDESLSNYYKQLNARRKDLAVVKQELQEITSRLTNEDLEEDVEQDLEKKFREKRALNKSYAREIKKLQSQVSVSVQYSVNKTGLTAVLPPGLTVHPKFLDEPVCWCPYNYPVCTIVSETTTEVEEMPITKTCPQNTIATGLGLRYCIPEIENKFVIKAKDQDGNLCESGGDKFDIECKDAELKASVFDKQTGVYDVSYFFPGDTEDKQCSIAITHYGRHILGSPFSVPVENKRLLVDFSSEVVYTKDWLDAAVEAMATVPKAKLWVELRDADGVERYKTTGVTTCKWSQSYITGPVNTADNSHKDKIELDNGDTMIITGKGWYTHKRHDNVVYNSYNIIINAKSSKPYSSMSEILRRMIVTREIIGNGTWEPPDNRISFSSAGFKTTKDGKWPKFTGTFRIFYMPL